MSCDSSDKCLHQCALALLSILRLLLLLQKIPSYTVHLSTRNKTLGSRIKGSRFKSHLYDSLVKHTHTQYTQTCRQPQFSQPSRKRYCPSHTGFVKVKSKISGIQYMFSRCNQRVLFLYSPPQLPPNWGRCLQKENGKNNSSKLNERWGGKGVFLHRQSSPNLSTLTSAN